MMSSEDDDTVGYLLMLLQVVLNILIEERRMRSQYRGMKGGGTKGSTKGSSGSSTTTRRAPFYQDSEDDDLSLSGYHGSADPRIKGKSKGKNWRVPPPVFPAPGPSSPASASSSSAATHPWRHLPPGGLFPPGLIDSLGTPAANIFIGAGQNQTTPATIGLGGLGGFAAASSPLSDHAQHAGASTVTGTGTGNTSGSDGGTGSSTMPAVPWWIRIHGDSSTAGGASDLQPAAGQFGPSYVAGGHIASPTPEASGHEATLADILPSLRDSMRQLPTNLFQRNNHTELRTEPTAEQNSNHREAANHGEAANTVGEGATASGVEETIEGEDTIPEETADDNPGADEMRTDCTEEGGVEKQ